MTKFRKHTDLRKVKEVALTFLEMEPEITSFYYVIHPFITSSIVPKLNGPDFYDIHNPKDYLKIKEMFKNSIERAKDYSTFQILISKQYASAFFKFTYQYLNEKDYCDSLLHLYVSLEYTNSDPNISSAKFIQLFKKPNKELLMQENDLQLYNMFPELVTVYRGVRPKGKVKALSWTTSYETAQWFANRFNENGKVYKAQIPKEHILCYTNARNEKEIILDFRHLINLELC